MSRVSVVIPVKDGERYLAELLDALAREGADEVLVIDSGSRDRSLEIARAAGAELLEIAPEEFGHGRTRNLGAERTSGELICFLTQDATPCPGWLDAYREAFALDERVGAAFGPHLPRADTSPMIARELARVLRRLRARRRADAPARRRRAVPLQRQRLLPPRLLGGDPLPRRAPTPRTRRSARDLLAAGWAKVYHPGAAVLHAHDYGALEFMRRYFDEYRGLRETTGHVEAFALDRRAADGPRRGRAATSRWMREQGVPAAERARWAARATVHHGGRRVFSALGSRAERVPAPLRRQLSLEGRDDGADRHRTPRPPTARRSQSPPVAGCRHAALAEDYADAGRVLRDGPAPLLDPIPGMAERERLRLALVVPPLRRGSGGHNTLFQLLSRLERRGHVCSVWLADVHGKHERRLAGVLRSEINECFAPFEGAGLQGLRDWQGADVAMATGWQTVHPLLALDNCRARAYVVNDHEPEFFPTSTERRARRRHLPPRPPLHRREPVAARPARRALRRLAPTPSSSASTMTIYGPSERVRRADTVVYYARHSTDRRAVPIGLLALAELHRRRPDVRIVLFGDRLSAARRRSPTSTSAC